MTNDNRKVLPKDSDSDYSLPGRIEEANHNYYPGSNEVKNSEYSEPPNVKSKPTNRLIIIGVFAFILISAGSFSYYFINQDEIDSKIIQSRISDPEAKLVYQYGVGKYGSDHAHAAIAVFVDNEQINFGLTQFQVTSKYIHFENHNPYQIHRHATDVPLEMLFASFGTKITQNCFTLNSDKSSDTPNNRFCTGQDKSLEFYINGEKYQSDISQYVIKHNDRILISFGDGGSTQSQLDYLKSLKIHDVPKKTPKYSDDNISF